MSGDRPEPERESEPGRVSEPERDDGGAPGEAAGPAGARPEPVEPHPVVPAPADSPRATAPIVTPEARARPRPQYGEYATPQRQAEIIAGSLPPVSPLLKPATRPAPPPGAPRPERPSGQQTGARPGPGATPAARAASERPRRRWDLVLSIALLAYGLLTIFGGLTQYRDIPSIINQAYEAQGIGEFTSIEQASTVGIVIVVVHTLLYVITALVTVRLLQARRLAFYVPVIGGVLAILVAITLILVLMLGDPAFNAYLGSAS